MAETMTKLEDFPEWIVAICDEIDTLEFTDAFDKFTPDAEMFFGTEVCRGPEEMKRFFVKIDSPLISKHELFEVWVGSGRTYVRGQAHLTRKASPDEQFIDPFQWMFYEDPDEEGKVRTWRVTAGPVETDAVV